MIFQSEHLSMIGLGIKDDKDIVDGNHLRWFFNSELGFPKYGFKLYRRYHADCKKYYEDCRAIDIGKTFDFSKITEGNHHSPFLLVDLKLETDNDMVITKKGGHKGILLRHYVLRNHKYLRIHFSETVCNITLYLYSSRKEYLKITYCFESKPFHERTIELKQGQQEIEIPADAVDCIQLIFDSQFGLHPFAILKKIEWITVSECAKKVDWPPWEKIADFCLPVTDAHYPCEHGYRTDWEAAANRLDRKKEGYDKETFDELGLYLTEIVAKSDLPQHARVKEESVTESSSNTEDPEPMDVNPLQMVLLSALDPGTAQIIGIYYVDTERPEKVPVLDYRIAEEGQSYDYKIVGCWIKSECKPDYKSVEEKLEDMYSVDFSSISLEDPPLRFEKYGFSFRSNNMISVENGYPRIRVREYLRIDFPRLMSMVHIEASHIAGNPLKFLIYKGDGSRESREFASPLSEIFEDHDKGIKSIKIFGDFYLYTFFYAEMNYAWITFNIKMEQRVQIEAPTGLGAHLLPGKSVVRGEGQKEVIYLPAAVGLKWNLPSLSILTTDGHVFYKIERQPLGKNTTPGPIDEDEFVQVDNGKPIFVPRLPVEEDETGEGPKYPSGWPPQTEEEKEQGIMPIFYVDAGDTDEGGLLEVPLERDTWYAYRLTGIDIFGRHSGYSSPTTVRVVDTFPPPPPLVISSKFLDPKDPYLQTEEIVWVANAQNIGEVVWDNEKGWIAEGENRKGFRVIWKWTEDLHIQAPDAEKFRIYFKLGLLNVLEGTIHEILSENRGYHAKGEITEFDAEKNIVSLKIKTKKELEVDIAYYHRFFKYYTNFFSIGKVESSTWDGLIQQISFTIDNPRSVSVKRGEPGIFDADYSRIEVYFDGEIEIQENSFAGRMLRQRGRNFLIMRNTASEILIGNPITRMTFMVQNLVLPPREIPEANRPVSLPVDQDNPLYTEYGDPENWKMVDQHSNEVVIEVDMDEGEEKMEEIENQWGDVKEIRYRLFDKFIPEDSLPEQYHLSPAPEEPITPGNFTITTIDESGNESRVSPLLPVFAVLRDKPGTPSPPDISVLWTTIPDYYGISHFDVKWPVAEKAYFYQVYRTMDRTLMLEDIEEHENGHPIDEEIIGKICDMCGGDSDRKEKIIADLGVLDEKIPEWSQAQDDQKQRKFKELMGTYNTLRNDIWQYLASLPGNEKAFSPVSDPLDPNDPENWSSTDMFFQDSIEGRGRNHYFYRTGAMDKAGNRSSLSIATPPVCVPDVIPPKPPAITKVVGGDRKTVICWKRNREPGMVRYEIYRTNENACSVDVRLMEKVAEIKADAEGMPLRARVIKSRKGDQIVLSGYLDVSFIPNAQSIDEVLEIDGNQEKSLETNYFGGFRFQILNVSIDDGNIDVKYMDTAGEEVTKQLKTFGGQVRLEVGNGEPTIASVIGVYRESDPQHSESILEGISSGEIVLESEDASSLRDKQMAVNYIDTKGDPHAAERVPYELEYTDEDLQADTYYYCLVAAREGVIGENGVTEKTIELTSFPSSPVTAAVYDTSPPEPPEWQRVEWIKIDEQGNEHPWDEEVQNYTPAVVLEWDSVDPTFSYLVEKREVDSAFWNLVTPWLKGEGRYVDKDVSPDTGYEYRIRVRNLIGNVGVGRIEIISPRGE